jgi:hypothetical protein
MTETQKPEAKSDVDTTKSAAIQFIDAVQNFGGATYPLGPITNLRRSPSALNSKLLSSGRTPDIGFSFPGQPLLIAQIQEMPLSCSGKNSDPDFILNEEQCLAMNDAATSFHTLYFIYCVELDYVEGLSAFSFVSFADFQNGQKTSSEPMHGNSSHSILPLGALRPLYELSGCGGDEKLHMADNRKRVRLAARNRAKKATSVTEALAQTSKIFPRR